MKSLIDFTSHTVGTVFGKILKDRTSGKNIIFATGTYRGFRFADEITKDALSKLTILPRVQKSQDEQFRRQKKSAEVFTPSELCKKMNDFADCEWFKSPDAFVFAKERDRMQNKGEPSFPKGKNWKDYVTRRVLEITCGEAPFLVSRYDAATGEEIPPNKRIGILDRKLRIIGENAKTQKEWNSWAYKAFESVYGYEFQGDSLLIARINLLETFCDYTKDRWGAEPSEASLKRIADIVSRNLWQMDGICGIIPNQDVIFPYINDDAEQTFLTSDKEILGKDISAAYLLPIDAIDCEIYDWQKKETVKYNDLKRGDSKMKFDFIIGNPPYHEDTKDTSDNPVFHIFMDEAYKIADKVELITPAKFLSNAGKTPKAWNKKMLEDKHLKVLYYTQNSADVFTNTDIRGGWQSHIVTTAPNSPR